MAIRLVVAGGLVCVTALVAAQPFEKDEITTSVGKVEVTFVGHGTLIFGYHGKTIHVDPYRKLADYASLPKADAILITHVHADHLDPAAIVAVRTAATEVVVAPDCAGKVDGAKVLGNGERTTVAGVPVAAVPAYNLVHKRPDGNPYHARGQGNGYVLSFGDTRFYVAGDTENVPEMKALSGIAVTFLPMNLPYTMTPEMVAEAARAFRPRILYPYHYGDTDVSRLVALLKDEKGIEVRIRRMK